MDFIPLDSKKKFSKNGGSSKKTGNANENSNKQKKKFVCADRNLIPRIKQYLNENQSKTNYVDIDELAQDLQQTYRGYQRKARKPFQKAVTKAYYHILKNDNEGLPNEIGKDKRDEDDSLDSDFSSENDNYVEIVDKNSVNNLLRDFYTKDSDTKGNSSSKKRKNSNSQDKKAKRAKVEDFSSVNRKTKKNSADLYLEQSSITFQDVAGCDKAVQEVCGILLRFRRSEVYRALGLTPPTGLLLHGPPGSGKTFLAYAIAGELGLPFFKVAATELVSGVSGESEEQIRDLFTRAGEQAPSIIFIDEIDAISPKRENAQREMERRIVTQLQTCLDALAKSESKTEILVVGATNRPDSLDPALRRAGRFDHEVTLGIPDEQSRLRIIEKLSKNIHLHESCDLKLIARNTPGFVGADLMALISEAAMIALNRIFCSMQNNMETSTTEINRNDAIKRLLEMLHDDNKLSEEQLQELHLEQEDFNMALKMVQPSAKREGFATIPDVTWDDIGALKNIRDEMALCILAPVKHPEYFTAFGLTTPAGILLSGPPGCGKTLLAKAIANETGINFISVKGPELLNMYVGESERAVRQCFQRARNSAPCIIFFDEIDSLCPRRSDSAESSSSARVVNQLLTEMDGLDARRGVFIIGATNRADIIDPAILRPGRLDKILYVGLPSPADRVDILKALTKDGKRPPLADDVNLMELGEDKRCENYTGADLSALVREASLIAVKNLISGLENTSNVSKKHFEAAFQKIKPSITKKDRLRYEAMQQSLAVAT